MDLDLLINPQALGPHLVAATGDHAWSEFSAVLIAGGKSNLTFELTSAAGSLILRRPPTGELLPRAHDMAREARVQRALARTNVPVPRIVLVESEPGTLDVPFYVMGKIEGVVPREEALGLWAPTPRERRESVDALVDTLALLHRVDPDAVGLSDYGRREGFVPRQVRTWTRQWESAKTHDVGAMEELARRLADHAWREPSHSGIVHGDYRMDNCIFAADEPSTILAVLDWELSTLGDPLADLGMLLFYWVEAGEPTPTLTPALTAEPGFPDRAYVADRYGRASGADLDDLPAYLAYAHFKSAGIAQGIAARVAAGQMAGQDFGNLDAEVERIAETGLAILTSTESI